jgi:hypothetical protein
LALNDARAAESAARTRLDEAAYEADAARRLQASLDAAPNQLRDAATQVIQATEKSRTLHDSLGLKPEYDADAHKRVTEAQEAAEDAIDHYDFLRRRVPSLLAVALGLALVAVSQRLPVPALAAVAVVLLGAIAFMLQRLLAVRGKRGTAREELAAELARARAERVEQLEQRQIELEAWDRRAAEAAAADAALAEATRQWQALAGAEARPDDVEQLVNDVARARQVTDRLGADRSAHLVASAEVQRLEGQWQQLMAELGLDAHPSQPQRAIDALNARLAPPSAPPAPPPAAPPPAAPPPAGPPPAPEVAPEPHPAPQAQPQPQPAPSTPAPAPSAPEPVPVAATPPPPPPAPAVEPPAPEPAPAPAPEPVVTTGPEPEAPIPGPVSPAPETAPAPAPAPPPEPAPAAAATAPASELFQGFTVIVAEDPDAWAASVAERVGARVISSAFSAEQVLAHRAEAATNQRLRDRLAEAERLTGQPDASGRLAELLEGQSIDDLRAQVARLADDRPTDDRPILLADPTRGLPGNRKRSLLAEFERLSKMAPVVLVTADQEVQDWAATR